MIATPNSFDLKKMTGFVKMTVTANAVALFHFENGATVTYQSKVTGVNQTTHGFHYRCGDVDKFVHNVDELRACMVDMKAAA